MQSWVDEPRHFVDWSVYCMYQPVTAVARAEFSPFLSAAVFFRDQLVVRRGLMIDCVYLREIGGLHDAEMFSLYLSVYAWSYRPPIYPARLHHVRICQPSCEPITCSRRFVARPPHLHFLAQQPLPWRWRRA